MPSAALTPDPEARSGEAKPFGCRECLASRNGKIVAGILFLTVVLIITIVCVLETAPKEEKEDECSCTVRAPKDFKIQSTKASSKRTWDKGLLMSLKADCPCDKVTVETAKCKYNNYNLATEDEAEFEARKAHASKIKKTCAQGETCIDLKTGNCECVTAKKVCKEYKKKAETSYKRV